jgi:hypothetical protein
LPTTGLLNTKNFMHWSLVQRWISTF